MHEDYLSDAAKAARAAYAREYRRKNPDRVREINKRFWERRAAQMAAATETETEGHDEEDRK